MKPTPGARDERGATLILALIFLFIMGGTCLGLAQLATTSLVNTTNLRTQRTGLADAESATTVAMQYVRYTWDYTGGSATGEVYSATPEACLPAGYTIGSSNPGVTATDPMKVLCTGSVSPLSATTRTVDFVACGAAVAACSDATAVLRVEVAYDDRDAGGIDNCYLGAGHPMATGCGATVTIDHWDVPNADR